MGSWLTATLNQLLARGSYSQIKFSKRNKMVGRKTPAHFVFFVFPIHFLISVLERAVLFQNDEFSMVVLSAKKLCCFSKKAIRFLEKLLQS